MSVRSKPNREGEVFAQPEYGGNELPEGWASGRFDSITELNPRHPSGLDDSQLVTFVPMTCVSESSPDFDRSNERPLAEVRKGYTHFADGDVLFAKITPCMENGKGAVATGLKNGLGCGTTELHVIRPLGGINPHYVYRFLQQESVRRGAAANFTGSAGQLRAPMSFIAELELPLPPLAEQRRIVGKLELLLGKVSSSQQRLSRVPGLLKRFRQSVLAAACSGKLTADWRESFPTEPCGDSEELSELPTSWRTQVLESITEAGRPISYGVLKPGPFVEDGIPLVRIVDIVRDRLALDEMHRVSPELSAQYRRTVLSGGEILISLVGTIGRIAWSPPVLCGANVHRNIGVIASGADVDSKFLSFSMQSESVQSQIRDVTTGASQPLLNLGDVRQLRIAIPPLTEQQEIVRRVEKLFAFADQIEARLKQAQTHVDRLTQSLLRKAFRGELVPTEHTLATADGRDYESASGLLERIQTSERAESQQPRQKRRQVRKK